MEYYKSVIITNYIYSCCLNSNKDCCKNRSFEEIVSSLISNQMQYTNASFPTLVGSCDACVLL